MVTHLGPGSESRTNRINVNNDRQVIKAKSHAGQSLLMHIQQYMIKGFRINRVTSDGEASIKAVRSEAESLGAELNILGHGSHAPHIESAIRHIKNKARSVLHSLSFSLASKLAAALIAFVVHTSNMVPKVNSVGHYPAHAAFTGRVPSYTRDAPHSFGQPGFLQKAQHAQSNSAAPRGDYCIWLGTTHNISGTHRCLNLETLREITGDVFRPALLTPLAVRRLTQLAGPQPPMSSLLPTYEEQLTDPSPPYALDPNRGVDDVLELLQPSSDGAVQFPSDEAPEIIQAESVHGDLISDADDVFDVPATEGVTETPDTIDQHVEDIYAVLTMNEAKLLYGEDRANAATIEELKNCIEKDVWDFLPKDYKSSSVIPSKMFLTPKKKPNGEIERIKGRIVAGGHRQDRSLFPDNDISSPTVALTSVLATAALAAHNNLFVMTLNHRRPLNLRIEISCLVVKCHNKQIVVRCESCCCEYRCKCYCWR